MVGWATRNRTAVSTQRPTAAVPAPHTCVRPLSQTNAPKNVFFTLRFKFEGTKTTNQTRRKKKLFSTRCFTLSHDTSTVSNVQLSVCLSVRPSRKTRDFSEASGPLARMRIEKCVVLSDTDRWGQQAGHALQQRVVRPSVRP